VIVVTGGSGLLGKAILREIKGSKGACRNCEIFLDLRDLDSIKVVMDRVRPEVVIHAGALSNADYCETNREEAYLVNYRASRVLAREAKRLSAFLVFISSDYVFDGEKGGYVEDDPPNPVNYYGLTKLAAERAIGEEGGHYAILRTSVIYGPWEARLKENFALWIIRNLKEGRGIRLVVDQISSPTLNLNLARMVRETVERRIESVFHVAGDEAVSRYEFGIRLAETMGLDTSLITQSLTSQMNWVARRPKNSSLNVDSVKALFRERSLRLSEALRELRSELSSKIVINIS